MNQERQKTDALSDAVEIPEGATHEIFSFGKRDWLKWDGWNWYIFIEYQNYPSEWQLTHSSIFKEFSSTLKPL